MCVYVMLADAVLLRYVDQMTTVSATMVAAVGVSTQSAEYDVKRWQSWTFTVKALQNMRVSFTSGSMVMLHRDAR